jgi:hypothetical protein
VVGGGSGKVTQERRVAPIVQNFQPASYHI